MKYLFFCAFLLLSPILLGFDIVDIDGKRWQKKALSGKYIIVNFWATWCSPCLKEIPMLAKVTEDYDQITVLGINYWDSVDDKAMRDFIDLYGVNYPIIRTDDHQDPSLVFGRLRGLPTTFIYDTVGKFMTKFEGELSREKLAEILPNVIQ